MICVTIFFVTYLQTFQSCMLNAALCRRTVYVSTFSVLHCYMLHSDSNRLMIYMICMLRAACTQVYVYRMCAWMYVLCTLLHSEVPPRQLHGACMLFAAGTFVIWWTYDSFSYMMYSAEGTPRNITWNMYIGSGCKCCLLPLQSDW